ncbi:pentatricopeptide repeat-containing protein 2, mitochondrial isoform X1 [Alosa alosa]|uniref:pentatricopeptide repeat-containing protein 2, mitochondrial isoform X1 n=1 Tax=Alosa alosa TaxID=278164 RepID=UPI0020152B6F|nr:pentatricopeptide repeat-containing protein 2, mitochondrial isoform X1 [Alosa alosa]
MGGGKENTHQGIRICSADFNNMALRGLNICVRLMRDSPRKGILQSSPRVGCLGCQIGAKRHLLSEDVVKLQDFQQRKLAVAHQVSGAKSDYFENVSQKLQKNELILKDELKLLLHLCQSADDMVTAKSAIYRYHEENRNVSFGDFKFGPLFMRLCYELGLEDMAATTVTDKTLKGFFSDSTSFNIAIDMLFMKECYDGALEVVAEMRKQGVTFNKDTHTLACATCYKLNTPKSYRVCMVLLEEGQLKGHMIPRHAYCFAAALAIKQNDLEKAKKFYSQIMNTESKLCMNLNVWILAMEGSIRDAVAILNTSILPNTPTFVKRPEFSQEVLEELQRQSVDGTWAVQVERVVARLQKAGQVTVQSLDAMLCHTPKGKRRTMPMLEERKTSRRTLRPLRSTLLSE